MPKIIITWVSFPMSAFSNWWKSSSWLPLISKLKRYYSYSLVLVSAISFKQSEAIFVDASHNFSLISAWRQQSPCLVFQLLEKGWKVKKRQKKLFSGKALSGSKCSENHMLLFPQRHSSWKFESQEARFNEIRNLLKEQRISMSHHSSINDHIWRRSSM